MQCNVGKSDKTVRYILGGLIIITGFYYQSWLGAIGLIPIVTASLSWCPLYSIFKLSSAPKS